MEDLPSARKRCMKSTCLFMSTETKLSATRPTGFCVPPVCCGRCLQASCALPQRVNLSASQFFKTLTSRHGCSAARVSTCAQDSMVQPMLGRLLAPPSAMFIDCVHAVGSVEGHVHAPRRPRPTMEHRLSFSVQVLDLLKVCRLPVSV